MTRGFIEKNPTAKNYANFTVNITDQFPVSFTSIQSHADYLISFDSITAISRLEYVQC